MNRVVFNNRHVMCHVTQMSSLLFITLCYGKNNTVKEKKSKTEE